MNQVFQAPAPGSTCAKTGDIITRKAAISDSFFFISAIIRAQDDQIGAVRDTAVNRRQRMVNKQSRSVNDETKRSPGNYTLPLLPLITHVAKAGEASHIPLTVFAVL